MLLQFFTLIVAPTIVGIVVKLFAYWLDKRDDD
ncbi:type I toxin-antitoxin system Fst family toxin [Enterococcus faecium]|nr:type I toxin-antitoxin system Fst family toxin [Enterococcus faecium]HAQ4310737.1 type I toxin-antitoxin system Fst family toxin [Enterococcus faecium]HAQ4319454.1 type I toxin-antitoxin system Fst family toxin [Enterococcus faecium]HAQ5011447.1 type I toxin-antitoxin system Fst family toxin [Enterococcus faecium]HAQ5051352.1 type I toxin-antitoxin system Fst family toxin [Enterococcus faecium]